MSLLALLALLAPLCGPLALAAPEAAPSAAGSEPSVPAPAATEGALRYEATLRDEYLAGQSILVPVRVWNEGSASAEAPDLERRPWLVAFTFDQGGGELERRRTTPPASDPGRMVRLSPRSQRRTLLEVPASSALEPAEYQLQVQLDPDTVPRVLATRTIRVAEPRPVEADLTAGVSAAGRSTDLTVWLHQATAGFDLYLSSRAGRRSPPAQWLGHTSQQVRPMLSEAPEAEGGARHVVWKQGDRGIGWVAVESLGVEAASGLVEAPWPQLELVGRPATDASGHLHVPVWIPAPKGPGGELRIVTVLDRGAVSYRRAATFPQRPSAIATTVDDSGTVNLLVATTDAVDLYTVRNSGPAHADLPVPGRRLVRAEAGVPFVDARFGLLDRSDAEAGGLAILTTRATAGGLESQWMGLKGTPLGSAVAVAIPEGGELAELLPSSSRAVGYLFKVGPRAVRYVEGTTTVDVEDSLHGDWGLVRDAQGHPVLLRTARGGPFQSRVLQPTP